MRSPATLGALVGESIAVFETRSDMAVEELHPEELEAVANAVPDRIEEFRRGRSCARQALRLLGVDPVPIGVGAKREPKWPDGVAGSITHCRGFTAAAVGWMPEIGSIGIDAELNKPLGNDIARQVLSDSELSWIAAQLDVDVALDTLMFSIKESIYKAWFPLEGTWLGFEQAEVHLELAQRTFSATLSTPLSGALSAAPTRRPRGRFDYDDQYILSFTQISDD